MERKSLPDRVASGAVVLIDVRTDDEWNAGHAVGAVHFELARMEKGELPDVSKQSTVCLYCQGGTRSAAARDILRKNGYVDVTNIGGLSDWQVLGGGIV